MEGTAVLKEQTEQFIGENPTDIVLTRRTKSPDGAGGSVLGPPTPLLTQRVRLVETVSSAAIERRTSAGEVIRPDYKMLMEWDADVLVGDTLTYNGLRMEVVWVVLMPYEKTAELTVRH